MTESKDLSENNSEKPTEQFKEFLYNGIITWSEKMFDNPNKEFWETLGSTMDKQDIYGGFIVYEKEPNQ